MTVPLPPRRPLLLSLLLLAVGAALLIAQQVGTFNSRQCARDDPALCWETPDPWPGFIGTVFALGGLGLLTAGFAGELLARRGRSAPPAAVASAESPSVAAAKSGDVTSVTPEVVPDVQDR